MFRRQKLRQDLNQRVGDIRLLMAVEESHCERNRSSDGKTFKLGTRSGLRVKLAVDFSGRIQPGQLEYGRLVRRVKTLQRTASSR